MCVCILCLAINSANAQDNNISPLIKYPDLMDKPVGMQPIIDEKDHLPERKRIERPTKAVTKPTIKAPTQAATPTISEPQKPSIIKAPEPITSAPLTAPIVKDAAKSEIVAPQDTLRLNFETVQTDITDTQFDKVKSDTIKKLNKNNQLTLKIASFGNAKAESSISAAKRRALSRALKLRQWLIEQNISSRRIDLNVEHFSGQASDSDYIELILQKETAKQE